MRASIDYEDVLSDIQKDVATLAQAPEKDAKRVLNEIGFAVQSQVIMTAPVSDKSYGGKGDHIANDVVYKVKKSRKTKEQYVTISGGKKTWSKWHVVNDGHLTTGERPEFVAGNHFADKAIAKCETSIDGIINRYCGDIVR